MFTLLLNSDLSVGSGWINRHTCGESVEPIDTFLWKFIEVGCEKLEILPTFRLKLLNPFLQTYSADLRSKFRKEVIQEQLPLPLPCYDLLPVTDPTVSPHEYMDLQVLPAPLSWRAVSAKFENVFTAAFWSAITSNSSFKEASFSLLSELRAPLMRLAPPCGLATHCNAHCIMCVAQGIRGTRWLDVIPTFLFLTKAVSSDTYNRQ